MKFYIEIDLPDDSPTISYTTDPLERCIAVATEVAVALPGAWEADPTVYTADSLRLQLQDEQAGHEADDPHCTCNDCIAAHQQRLAPETSSCRHCEATITPDAYGWKASDGSRTCGPVNRPQNHKPMRRDR
jgi:hypothetical protein